MEKTRSWDEKEKIMTLFKQMAIAISLIIIIMLGAVMIINYSSAKKDMTQSLYETTVNNISSLTSRLADTGADSALIVSTIDAEFDSGYYRMIEFKSNDGTMDYKQLDNDPIEGVPAWFITLSHIELESVSADVSSGWAIIGIVSVKGDVGIVYKALYKMLIQLSYLFVVSVIAALVLLGIFLHFALKPLSNIQSQSEAILNDEFIIQDKIPFTTEFKDVVKGMNAMVKKVEDIFSKGNLAAQRNKELLYNDPTTKLFNRRYLMLTLPELIKAENRADGGVAIFIALNGAEIINQVLGRQKADELFLEFAKILKNSSSKYEEKVIARVNGTEFTLVLSNCEISEIESIVNTINRALTLLLSSNGLDHTLVYINMGICRYRPSTSIGELLTRVDNALSEAKSKEFENSHIYEDKDSKNAFGKEQWRKIIEESIEKNQFHLKFWPTLNAQTKNLEHNVMTFTIDDGKDKKFFYGDFIAPAINLGLVSKMYLVTLRDLITNRHEELNNTECSIRLSNEFIKDSNSFDELTTLFKNYSNRLKFKLSFEVTDRFAINNTAIVKGYVELFSKYGFGFGINTFSGESNDYKYLKELNPKFLKADCAFLLDQSENSMNALQVITDSLGIEIVATFVKTQEEIALLEDKQISRVQGPITDTIH